MQFLNFAGDYSDKQPVKRLNSFLNFLIFSMLAVIVAIFFYVKSGHSPAMGGKEKMPELSSQELDGIVNKYIKTTNQEALKTKIMAEKFIIESRNKLAEAEIKKKIKQDKEDAAIPLERQIRKEPTIENTDSPAEIINSKLNEKNEQNQVDELERKEYARQWILNARKAGYLLELSPDLEVIKYTPIRKPSQHDDSIDSYPSD